MSEWRKAIIFIWVALSIAMAVWTVNLCQDRGWVMVAHECRPK